MTARKSGLRLGRSDIAIVLGMIDRNDRRHDIAAWFGVNQGRIADAEKGKYGKPTPASAHELPQTGPPGIKGRRLRVSVGTALTMLTKGDIVGAKAELEGGVKQYDAYED